ncbi:MAG TPA: hypothetical protein VFA49_09740, partial [Chloroflexota bacterium]|nr:hypothetical protein [Chloroflexota bacterium]
RPPVFAVTERTARPSFVVPEAAADTGIDITSSARFEVVGLVDAARVVLVLGRVPIQGISGWVIEEQHPIV